MSTIIVTDEIINVIEVAEQGPPGPQGATGPAGPSGVSDHGALSGLGDDDHPHYLNTARGDARYALVAHNHSGVYSAVGHGHGAADISDFAATVRATVLTGLGAGSNTAIAATDTILGAFAKLQNQISNFGGMAIGGAIGNSPTAGSALFVGAGGVLAQENDGLFWDATNKRLKVGVAGTNANRQMIFGQFPGEDYAAIFSGGVTPATNNYALGFAATQTILNTGPSGQISFRTENFVVASVSGSAAFTFFAKDANRVPFAVKLASSQTSAAAEVRNSSDSVIASISAGGQVAGYNGGLLSNPTFSSVNDLSSGFSLPGSGNLAFVSNGNLRIGISGYENGFNADSQFIYGWSPSGALGAYVDTGLARVGAAVIQPTAGPFGGGAIQWQEMSAPSAPGSNKVIVFAEDNGSGKTRLMAQFATGAAQQISIEP